MTYKAEGRQDEIRVILWRICISATTADYSRLACYLPPPQCDTMNRQSNKLAYKEQRDAELYEAYKKALTTHTNKDGSINMWRAIEAAVKMPCSRFWISEGKARREIGYLLSDPGKLERMIPSKRNMYRELLGIYQRMRADPAYSDLTDMQVAYLASDQPASEFFMTPKSAHLRICHERKRRKGIMKSVK